MPAGEQYFPVTFRLTDNAGAPIVRSTKLKVLFTKLPDSTDPTDAQLVDLAAVPPVTKLSGHGAISDSMVDHYVEEEKEVSLLTTVTDLGRDYLKSDDFTLEVKVRGDDEQHTVPATPPSSTVLDHIPLVAAGVAVRNVTQSTTLTEGTNYAVDYPTGTVNWVNGVVAGDTVEFDYNWEATETTDYTVDYDDGLLTKITLADGTDVIAKFKWIPQPGIYIYVLDVSSLEDGRYLVSVQYEPGVSPSPPDVAIQRFGTHDFIVRSGIIWEEYIANTRGTGNQRVLLKTREDNVDLDVIGDVRLSLFDSNGDSVITIVQSDLTSGDVEVALVPGTYEVWPFKANTTWDPPVTITVVDDPGTIQTFTILGGIISNTTVSIAAPNCCTVYGNVSSLGCEPMEGIQVRAQLLKPPLISSGRAVSCAQECVETDTEGNFSINITQGATIRLIIDDACYSVIRQVPPTSTSCQFDELIDPNAG